MAWHVQASRTATPHSLKLRRLTETRAEAVRIADYLIASPDVAKVKSYNCETDAGEACLECQYAFGDMGEEEYEEAHRGHEADREYDRYSERDMA